MWYFILIKFPYNKIVNKLYYPSIVKNKIIKSITTYK